MTDVVLDAGSEWIAPAGVVEVSVDIAAGWGGSSSNNAQAPGFGWLGLGGNGNRITGILPTVPGQTLRGWAGTAGGQGADGGAAGSPDGTAGMAAGSEMAAGGGGSSKLTMEGAVVVWAAGGGGGGVVNSTSDYASSGGVGYYPDGFGGTSPTGAADRSTAGKAARDGTSYEGTGGGGGGGGFHTGGSGKDYSGGGGGAGFGSAILRNLNAEQGNSGDGYVHLRYTSPTPQPPALVQPADESVAPPGVVTLTWAPRPFEIVTATEVQYKKVGGTVHSHTETGNGQTWATASLGLGDYQWRARTHGEGSEVSAWSTWATFHVETPPATPTITSPAASSVTQGVAVPITWTSTGQVEWQAQIVDGTEVVWDSGETVGTDLAVTGQATRNNATLTVRVRIFGTGHLWSAWASVTITSLWASPAAPILQMRPDPVNAAIGVEWTQPPGDVPVDHYDVHAIEDGVPIPVNDEPIGPDVREYVFWVPRSDVQTVLSVIAYADSGTHADGIPADQVDAYYLAQITAVAGAPAAVRTTDGTTSAVPGFTQYGGRTVYGVFDIVSPHTSSGSLVTLGVYGQIRIVSVGGTVIRGYAYPDAGGTFSVRPIDPIGADGRYAVAVSTNDGGTLLTGQQLGGPALTTSVTPANGYETDPPFYVAFKAGFIAKLCLAFVGEPDEATKNAVMTLMLAWADARDSALYS